MFRQTNVLYKRTLTYISAVDWESYIFCDSEMQWKTVRLGMNTKRAIEIHRIWDTGKTVFWAVDYIFDQQNYLTNVFTNQVWKAIDYLI
jgi:hypothetical protein